MCAAALTDNDHLIAEHRANIKNIHAARLFPIIHSVFDMASFEQKDLDGIAVSIGPGSFTGLRIGLSAAKGMAIGQNIPIVAVPTLQALASNAPIRDGLVCAILQSRVNEFYIATYSRNNYKDTILQDTSISTFEELVDSIPSDACLMGHTQRFFEEETLKKRCFFAPADANYLSAYSVAKIGSQKLNNGEVEDVHTLEPKYHQQFIAGKPKKVLH
jgi:tRNA threonylcarbamoyladenosine biosynthesis protein TsaB